MGYYWKKDLPGRFRFLIFSGAFAAPNIVIDGSMETTLTEWNGFYTNGEAGDNEFVDPGWGGQEFDVERIGLYISDSTLYFGLQTGFEINFGEWYNNVWYDPGDIAIDIGSDGIYEFAIRFSDDNLNDPFLGINDVGTDNQFAADLDIFVIDGDSVWDTSYDGFSDPVDNPQPFKLYGGTELASSTISAIYSRERGETYDPYRNTLEAAINFDTLTASLATLDKTITETTDITIHWTMSCGNDYLDNTFTYTPPETPNNPTPEPATLLLFGMGLLGAGAYGRRRLKIEDK